MSCAVGATFDEQPGRLMPRPNADFVVSFALQQHPGGGVVHNRLPHSAQIRVGFGVHHGERLRSGIAAQCGHDRHQRGQQGEARDLALEQPHD